MAVVYVLYIMRVNHGAEKLKWQSRIERKVTILKIAILKCNGCFFWFNDNLEYLLKCRWQAKRQTFVFLVGRIVHAAWDRRQQAISFLLTETLL